MPTLPPIVRAQATSCQAETVTRPRPRQAVQLPGVPAEPVSPDAIPFTCQTVKAGEVLDVVGSCEWLIRPTGPNAWGVLVIGDEAYFAEERQFEYGSYG